MEGDNSSKEIIDCRGEITMAEKQKRKAKETTIKPNEVKPVKKYIAWSRGTPTIVVPEAIRDALGLKPKEKTEVEISLPDDKSGILVRVVKE